jgi:hypothetical protein
MIRLKSKYTNLVALFLFILINGTYCYSYNLRPQSRFSPKLWMQTVDELVVIYKNIDTCYKGCPTMDCISTEDFEDTSMHISSDDDYICLVVKIPIDENEKSTGNTKFIKKEICDSYCQPVMGKRCRKKEVCINQDCSSKANRFLC